MDKDKRNITSSALTESKHLLDLLDPSSVQTFKKMVPELQDTWFKKQMYRTETEMRVSVLSDNKHGTKASKYWQSVREQNSHFQRLMQLSFDYRKITIEIKQLFQKMKKEKDSLKKELIRVEAEEKIFNKTNMELQGRARMQEICLWSKLKKEFNDGSFDDKNVNTHQLESYEHLFTQRKRTLTPGSSQPEVFNVLGQFETLNRVKKAGEMKLDDRTAKKNISEK